MTISSKFDYIIYTDGACLGNPGPGGWAAIIFDREKKKKILKGNEESTTNNRMELIATIKAIEIIEYKSNIKIYTDSKYVIDGISSWIINWKKNNWKTSSKEPVKNVKLWQKLDYVSSKHEIVWEWIKGHSGHILNEEVDELARIQAGLLKF
ncbi:MAG: ribonuclease HI [Rickettsiales bacterium]|nr:ribonuclease HI [Rickettsiales bacterium]